MNLAEFIIKIESFNANVNIPLIRRAYEFSDKAHQGQKRQSGEPFIEHCLEVAFILAEQHPLEDSILPGGSSVPPSFLSSAASVPLSFPVPSKTGSARASTLSRVISAALTLISTLRLAINRCFHYSNYRRRSPLDVQVF